MAGSKHLLIVEVDAFISDMYARALIKSGYKVDFAKNGKEGLEKAQSGDYQLILLDIMMPEMTGIEFLRAFKEASVKNKPKIVILTNLAQDETSREALKAQADGYLIKADVVPSKLLQIVNQLLA